MTGLLYEQSDSVDNAKSPDESSSSSSDEEDLDLVDPLPPPVAKQRSTLLQFTKSLLPKRVALLDERVSRSFRRSSDASTPSSIATIVAEEEESRTDDDEEAEAADETVEDEIWENQRWQTIAFRGTTQVRGWSDVALLLTDRGAFSDRLGNVSFPQLAAIGVPPGGWQVTSPWRLASSQALTATSGSHKCNQDGWTYAPTFGSLDSNLASGNENTLPSPRWLVRRRSKRAAKVKHLDNLCRVLSDSLASQDRPGLFSLHLSGEAEPRVFNAYNAPTRLLWVSILQQCIQDSPAPNYETLVNRRSMRKGAVWEFSRASGAVKGVVGEGQDPV
ncbi:hypothetical protein BASA81_015615 [Batrachochytrium salamandrivorans]|nr:hypothetical protein BASA81_015615 [Batrachochytrium salamandrivorans]